MDFSNCLVCGKLCAKTPMGLCPVCSLRQDEFENTVADYIRDHRRCTVQEVQIATRVPEKIIYRMIKSGRIQECKDMQFPCARCGKLISTGRLCKTCMGKFMAEAEKVTSEIKAGMPIKGKGKVKGTGEKRGMYTHGMDLEPF